MWSSDWFPFKRKLSDLRNLNEWESKKIETWFYLTGVLILHWTGEGLLLSNHQILVKFIKRPQGFTIKLRLLCRSNLEKLRRWHVKGFDHKNIIKLETRCQFLRNYCCWVSVLINYFGQREGKIFHSKTFRDSLKVPISRCINL